MKKKTPKVTYLRPKPLVIYSIRMDHCISRANVESLIRGMRTGFVCCGITFDWNYVDGIIKIATTIKNLNTISSLNIDLAGWGVKIEKA